MIWVYTCEFHRRFPLDYTMWCTCSVIKINVSGDPNVGFGFTGFINTNFERDEKFIRERFHCIEVPL